MVMDTAINEGMIEGRALRLFESLGYTVASGPDLDPDGRMPERAAYDEVVLRSRLRGALERINPALPPAAVEQAVRRLLDLADAPLAEANHRFHRYLSGGVDLEISRAPGQVETVKAWLFDWADLGNNDWLVVNQWTVVQNQRRRRADIVVYINGLPLAVLELKTATGSPALLQAAYKQLQTYQHDIPRLFVYNEVCLVSNGPLARVGPYSAPWERFMPWRSVDGSDLIRPLPVDDIEDSEQLVEAVEPLDPMAPAPLVPLQIDVALQGVFTPFHFLDLVRNFITFEIDGLQTTKKLAAYHQFFAVNKAIERTVRALPPAGDRRVGVVWHTQGSGKSLSMVFYAGKISRDLTLANPTIVVVTDRNDLDNQLYTTFAASQELLRQTPQQADYRDDLGELLRVQGGGLIFTTIQKFPTPPPSQAMRPYSERRNIIVIVDEAHRSQYGFEQGFAHNLRAALPNASFIAFTGTPVDSDDRNTRSVFGHYIDVYDIHQSLEDGATVPIYYEARLAQLDLNEAERLHIDPDFEEVTEEAAEEQREQLKTRWSSLESIAGTEKRLSELAADIVAHFEQRTTSLEGKGLIVGMSRAICARLYNAIIALRPDWHHESDAQGVIKVVITGNAEDDLLLQPHIRTKAGRDALARRFKDSNDPLRLVIVRDMWLTGFDVPSLHTMYLDKPMRGHNLMQAIARVNRVFKDKPGGLIVDYIGLAEFLREAIAQYTAAEETPVLDLEQAADVFMEQFDIIRAMLHGFHYQSGLSGTKEERLAVAWSAANYLVGPEEGQQRFLAAVRRLSRAFALAVPHERALAHREEVAFFQLIAATLLHTTASSPTSTGVDAAVQQIVNRAIAPMGVVDIFAAAGVRAPDISIFSDEFLAELQGLSQRNLTVHVLEKLINDQILSHLRTNLVQQRSFARLLDEAITRYHNRAVDTTAVIAELIDLAKRLRAESHRSAELGLSIEELAFYDALVSNDSARAVLGDATLRAITHELVQRVRENATIDWTLKESARANMRVVVKRLLRKYEYPPDKRDEATRLVLEQAEVLGSEWAA